MEPQQGWQSPPSPKPVEGLTVPLAQNGISVKAEEGQGWGVGQTEQSPSPLLDAVLQKGAACTPLSREELPLYLT